MNCFNHPDLISVGVCQDCQKGLCNECASKYSIPICIQCNLGRKGNEKNGIYKELFMTFGFAIIGTYFFMKNYKYSENINMPFEGFETNSCLGKSNLWNCKFNRRMENFKCNNSKVFLVFTSNWLVDIFCC